MYNIDNLPKDATASEMEQAIIAHERQAGIPKNDVPTNPLREAAENIAAPKLEPKEPKQVTEPEPTETTEALDETVEAGTPAEAVEPEQLPKDKFSGDYSKLSKSYEESVKWNTRQAQELSELKSMVRIIQASAQPKQPESPVSTVTPEQLADAYERDPIGTTRWVARAEADAKAKEVQSQMQGINAQLGGFLAQAAVERKRSAYEDFRTLEDDVKMEVSKLPAEVVNNPQYYDHVLDTAYWTVKGRKSVEESANAREAGRREIMAKKTAKKAAYVEGSGKSSAEQPFDQRNASAKEQFEYMKAIGLVHNETY